MNAKAILVAPFQEKYQPADIPAYQGDAYGNGTAGSGETDWQSATDLGLKVFITRPKNNTVIP